VDAAPKKDWAWSALLVLAVLAVYLPATRNGFIWDDDQHVTKAELRSIDGLVRIWTQPGVVNQYYPLVHTAFWVEHRIFGDAPRGYHVVNILLHATAAVLVLRILRQLDVPAAPLAAALFALHPVQVETVAWVSELKNTLSGVFYLGAALVYFRYDRTRTLGAYIVAFGLFMLGLLSKTVVATLPAALLVVFWWKRGRLQWKSDVWPLVPFFVAGAMAGLLSAWTEQQFIGARGPQYQLTVIERCLVAGRAFWFYLGKLAWPAELIFIYPRWQISQQVWWQYLFPAAAVVLVVAFWKLRRRWRGPLAASLFFAGMLFPTLGFFNVFPFQYSFVADHFQYLACIGPLVLAGTLFRRLKLTAAILPVLLASMTWRQSATYADAETVWRATLARNPDCSLAHINLGVLLAARGQSDAATAHYRRALAIKPQDAAAYYNWANLLAAQGRTEQAMSFYQLALQFDPSLAVAHYNWANLLAAAGRPEEALSHYRAAIECQPDFPEAYLNIGHLLATLGQSDGAIAAYQAALRLRPDFASAHYNLANELAARGRVDEAIGHYEAALRLQPNYAEAHFNLSAALAGQGRLPEALEQCEQANRLTGSSNALMLTGLAHLYAAASREDQARPTAERALTLALAQTNAPLRDVLRADLARYARVPDENKAGNP
jgi:tetratricopeptide (TPR) repeat protein